MFKFHLNKLYKYTKGKSVFQVIAEIYAFGFLMPLAIIGICFMFYQVIFNGVTI